VKARIADAVLLFWERRAEFEEAFHAEDLLRFVQHFVPTVAPDSPGRVLRNLRLEGKCNFRLIDKAGSHYQALPLGEAPPPKRTRKQDLIAQLREENAALRKLLEDADVVAEPSGGEPERAPGSLTVLRGGGK
jgi:hypothetical protein